MERKRYSGRSRTTKWRRKKRIIEEGLECSLESSSESDTDVEPISGSSSTRKHQGWSTNSAHQCGDLPNTSNFVQCPPASSSFGDRLPNVVNNNLLEVTDNTCTTEDIPAGTFLSNVTCNNELQHCEVNRCLPPLSTSSHLLTSSNGYLQGDHNAYFTSAVGPHTSSSLSSHSSHGSNSPWVSLTSTVEDSATSDSSLRHSSSCSDSSIEGGSNFTDDDFSSDLECFQAHYLEEEPENLQVIGEQHQFGENDDADPDDPDDRDPPQDPGHDDDDGNVSDESEEDMNVEVANFIHDNLNVPLNLADNLTKGETVLLELACSVRHNKTFLSILDTFKNLNLLFGPRFFPACKSALWSSILLNRAGIQSHVYCSRVNNMGVTCGSYISRKDLLGNVAQCLCGYEVPTSKAKFFVNLNLRNQLRHFLCIPGMWENLQYPQRRHKLSENGIEDIYDGEHYQRLKQDGGILSSPYNFSYVFNTDGCNPTKKGSIKMWPIYIRINELPPQLRQKFVFLAAVFIDHVEPNFQAFLRPFVRQANSLSRRGILWRPDGVNEVVSRFIPYCHCVDSPARFGILHMSHWNSDFGCTFCTHQGVQAGGNQRYSFLNVEGLPPVMERTHAGMQADMLTAQRDHRLHVGHKGAGQMLLLQHHDLREGQAHDDLHQDHEGCAKDITELLLTRAPRVVEDMPFIELLRRIDRRLLPIKTPSRISRKPRSIKHRSKYSGTEWRNWLLFYSVPCMTDLINPRHLELLASFSHACYILSEDVISPENLNVAERLYQRCGRHLEEMYGLENIKFNLHVTANHKVNSVRQLGPPWAYSTYNFESMNSKFMKFVTSPKGAIMQVITRALLHLTVHSAQYDNRVQEQVRERVQEILNKQDLKRITQVGPHMYLVGRETERVPNAEEEHVLAREGFHVEIMDEYNSCLIGNTRYKSLVGQNPNIKSDDTFIYTRQNTYCTIRKFIKFTDETGEVRSGAFVTEHDVIGHVPVARHLSVLRDHHADLNHYLPLGQFRSPAIKITVGNRVYAVSVPNCFEID